MPNPNSEPFQILDLFNNGSRINLTPTLLNAGYVPTIYSDHYFPRGIAKSATATGKPMDEVKKMCRRKPHAFDNVTQKSTNILLYTANLRLQVVP
jgi:hypothetical protein